MPPVAAAVSPVRKSRVEKHGRELAVGGSVGCRRHGSVAGRNGNRTVGRERIIRVIRRNRAASRKPADPAKTGTKQSNPSGRRTGGVSSFHTSSVGVTGFEPATLWSQTRYATGLRYTPNAAASAGISIKKQTTLSSSLPICRGDWIRTSDLQLPKLAR